MPGKGLGEDIEKGAENKYGRGHRVTHVMLSKPTSLPERSALLSQDYRDSEGQGQS